ncbi:MAG: 30S ribosomal protein S16 [Deltaproteobacteria bacterium]|nr:30S ribosomal protein S16 [Deltaproteobacteria bacterium]
MALAIRLNRIGGKGKPYYRVVAVDTRTAPQAGKSLEQLGSYDPRAKDGFKVNFEKLDGWLKKGAKASPTVARLIERTRKAAAAQ